MATDPRRPGPYAVGAASAFVRDHHRPFDRWGEKYKTAAIGRIIRAARDAGDPQVVPIEIHYPVVADPLAEADFSISPARVLPPAAASSLTPATNADYLKSPAVYQRFTELLAGGAADSDPEAADGMDNAAARMAQLEAADRRSYRNAAIAPGRFPVIVLSHGLGAAARGWTAAAEHLASYGYFVVSTTYISDSFTPLVFHDPNSRYAQGLDPARVMAAETDFSSDNVVFRNFFDLMWGAPPPSGDGDLQLDGLVAKPGGAAAAAIMMGELFEQRVEDIVAVLDYLRALDRPVEDCRVSLDVAGEDHPLCGAFVGSIDASSVGLMGHSLGSITSQVASVWLDEVQAVVGLNNGLPRTWEPRGGFPDASGNETSPDGVTKPIAFLSGAEDAFLDMVWRTIFLDGWTRSGGDVNEIFPLPAEQATPTRDNPLPIVASSYARARGPRINVMTHAGNHDVFTDLLGTNIPYSLALGRVREATRFPKGPQRDDPEFALQRFDLLGWVDTDGIHRYVPHDIRNYYAVSIFKAYVEVDDRYLPFLLADPFAEYATTKRDLDRD